MTCVCGRSEEECVRPTSNVALRLRPGMVVVCEGGQGDFVSKLVRWATGSRLTHCFLVTGEDELVEAYVPRVRKGSLLKKLSTFPKEDRAYYVLDYPELTQMDRCRLVQRAHAYVGRWYDLGQAVLYGLARRFRKDGAGTLTCSRLVTAVYKEVLGIDLFDISKWDPSSIKLADLVKGECTPDDLLKSKLVIQQLIPSSRIKR